MDPIDRELRELVRDRHTPPSELDELAGPMFRDEDTDEDDDTDE